jgi:hypothetical protein
MRNISMAVRGHYDDDGDMWAIIIRRFCDTMPPSGPNTDIAGHLIGIRGIEVAIGSRILTYKTTQK